MGIETWINKDLFIYGHPLRSKHELEQKIKECTETMSLIREKLRTLVFMTEPKKFIPDDEDVMFYLDREFTELMEEYDRARIDLTRLWEFEEDWDKCHDEKDRAILPVDPLSMKEKKIYMGGDYCECVLEDGNDVPEDYWDVYHGFVKKEDCTFRHIYGYAPYEPQPEMLDEEYKKWVAEQLTNETN